MKIRNALVGSVICLNSLAGITTYSPVVDFEKKEFATTVSSHYEGLHLLQKIKSEKNHHIVLETKKCKKCGGIFPISLNSKESFFYPIKASDEYEVRWEDNCKGCKKIIRKEREEKQNLSNIVNGDAFKDQPKEKLKKNEVALLELQNFKETEAHKHQSNMLSKQIDFSELEKCTKEPLTDSNKKEAVDNFNKFISILLQEHKKQTGEHIYVKNK